MSTNQPPTETDDLDPFEELASDFADRYRAGELPSIEEYATTHPDLADEIRELFPTIAAMEKAKVRCSPPIKPTSEKLPIEQLGDFRLLGEIGRGGMGIVYEAEQVSLGRHVAVKVLPQQALLDERHLRRFEREAKTAAKLHHTNIVPVFGVGQQDGFHYIVMQFIAGVGLDEVLLALRRQIVESNADEGFFNASSSSRASHANYNAQALLKGEFGEHPVGKLSNSLVRNQDSAVTQSIFIGQPGGSTATKTIEFSVDREEASELGSKPRSADEAGQLASLGNAFYRSVARIGEQVADALAYAHEQGTLHRDIKPGNLLLDSTGTVWVADFGLAKFAEQDNVSRTGDIVGTLSYIPPESFSGETDSRGDIYSLGLSLFELLTLRPAFFGQDRTRLVREITEGKLPRLSKLNPSIPRDLETVVLKAVAHRPEDRYATANELASDLNCYLNDMPINARRMSLPEQFTRWCRKNKTIAALSATVLSLLLLLTVTLGVSNHRMRKVSKGLQVQKDIATEQAEIAEKARVDARFMADESISGMISMVVGFLPARLPVSSDGTLTQFSAIDADQFSEEVESQSVVIVAPPPMKQETAARLEVVLHSLNTLAQLAGKKPEFAATFADLTMRVGTLHKALGDSEKAIESLDDAISRYEELLSIDDSLACAIGLAVSLNEKGDLLGQAKNHRESQRLFHRARTLLEDRREAVSVSPRAQYELARTLFLMSVQRQQAPHHPRPPSIIEMFGGASGNLRKAIRVLEPLVESESNSEYRYLLARCYSALSVVAPPHDQESLIVKANASLKQLVEAQPDVDDYQYEFAMSKLHRARITMDAIDRMQLTEGAVDLLNEISSTNPGVFSYQIARSRALGTHMVALDRYATQLEMANDAESLLWRTKSTEVALETTDLFFDLQDRFSEQYSDRLSETHLVDAADVVARSDSESAIPIYREAAKSESSLPRCRAQLGLAAALKTTFEWPEAIKILSTLRVKLLARCEKEIGKWRPRGNDRFFDTFVLLCATEFEQSGMEQTEQLIREFKERYNAQASEKAPKEVVAVQMAEFNLKLADAYSRIGEFDRAQTVQVKGRDTLEEMFEKDQSARPVAKFLAARILMDFYRRQGNVAAAAKLRENLPRPPHRKRPKGRP